MKKIFTYDEEFGVCARLCYLEQRPVIEKDYINNVKEIWEQLYAEQEGLDETIRRNNRRPRSSKVLKGNK